MTRRNLLHVSKLNQFKEYVVSIGYELQETKGIYEVLRATSKTDCIIIYKKQESKEHLSVMQKDVLLVLKFLNKSR